MLLGALGGRLRGIHTVTALPPNTKNYMASGEAATGIYLIRILYCRLTVDCHPVEGLRTEIENSESYFSSRVNRFDFSGASF